MEVYRNGTTPLVFQDNSKENVRTIEKSKTNHRIIGAEKSHFKSSTKPRRALGDISNNNSRGGESATKNAPNSIKKKLIIKSTPVKQFDQVEDVETCYRKSSHPTPFDGGLDMNLMLNYTRTAPNSVKMAKTMIIPGEAKLMSMNDDDLSLHDSDNEYHAGLLLLPNGCDHSSLTIPNDDDDDF